MPADRRDHFVTVNTGTLENDRFVLDGRMFECSEFLHVEGHARGEFEFAFEIARSNPGFMPDTLVPFTTDRGGAFFCLRRADQHVVFFDPEFADDLDTAIVELAPSLRAFIDGMH